MARRMARRLTLLIAVAMLPLALWAALPLVSTGQDPDDIQRKIERKRDQIEWRKGRERVLSTDISAYTQRIGALQSDITVLQARQVSLQADLDAKRAELADIQERLRQERLRLARLRARLAEAKVALAARLVEIYKSDEPDMVTVVLEADGFAELLERTEFMRRVSSQDARIIDRVRAAKAEATATAARLDRLEKRAEEVAAAIEAQVGEVAAVKGELVSRRDRYANVRAEKHQLLASTRADRHELEDHVDALEREQGAIIARLSASSGGGSGVAGPIKQGSGSLIWPANGSVSSPLRHALGPAARGHRHAAPRGHPAARGRRRHGRDRRLGGRLRELHVHPAQRVAVHLLRPPVEHRRRGRPVGGPGPGHRQLGQHGQQHRAAPALRGPRGRQPRGSARLPVGRSPSDTGAARRQPVRSHRPVMDETDVGRGRPARLGDAELRAVLEGLPDATVAANVHGRIVFVNSRAEELFGYSSGELLGRPVDVIWPERVRERYLRNMRLYFETEHPLRFTSEARGLRRDGSEFVGEMSWGTVETSNGRLLLAIGRDISARREALARLQRQSDQQAVVTDLGERALSGEDLRALSQAAVERLCETPAIVRAAVTGAAADTLATCGNARQGEVIELELRTASRLLGTLAVEADRELDADQHGFLRAIAHVLTLAAERTAGDERLRQAQKMAAVGRLAGGVAHDFNNLLTAISGFVAIARAQVGGGAGAHELAEAERATERAAEVTRQLLAVSRRQVLEPALVDLGAVAEELAPMLRRLIGSHVDVSLALADDLAPVLADRGQLAQVLLNLAVNAGDAMPDGGTLTIATSRLEDGDVGFVVTDTGHGMPPDVLEHAFEPFYTTKAPGHGTGLGLATVHGIVDQSGGRVSVRSSPGEGAEFTVAFPSAVRGATVGDRPAPVDAGRVDGHETVLLCEDASAVRQLLEHVLAANGYRVLPAALPSEALELALTHQGRIDALLTDVIMPEMAGPDLAEQVRAVRPGLPTLFVSGYTAETLSSRGGLPPGSAFVEKPFAAATLLQALRGLLDQPPA